MGPVAQEDPIGIAGGLNLYGYADGDPINFSDPFGLCVNPWDPSCIEAAATATMQAFAAGINQIGEGIKELAGAAATMLFGPETLVFKAAAPLIGSRSAIRAALVKSDLGEDLARGIRRVLGSGKGSQYSVEFFDEGGATVRRFVEGENTVSGAVWTYRLDEAGNVAGVSKQAFDMNGVIPGTLKVYR